MAFRGRHSALYRSGLVALILLVVYFSQVYPYFHFHHVHADHPITVETDWQVLDAVAHHAHHGHDHQHDIPAAENRDSDDHHHHPEFSQHIDWHLVRSQLNNPLADHFVGLVTDRIEIDPTPEPNSWLARIIQFDLPESVPPADIESRGPPALA